MGKKQKFVFVLGEEYEAEQVELYCNRYVWGNKSYYSVMRYGCDIASFVLKIKKKDERDLADSVEKSKNHSAILPLEVD